MKYEIPASDLSGRQILEDKVKSRVRSDFVFQAFRKVDRTSFVPSHYELLAYTDMVIPLGNDSSLSQPTLVAMMIDHLNLTGKESVLEVGAGTGYVAAILSHCATKVYSVEYNRELVTQGQDRLKKLGITNVEIVAGDGALGLPEKAPFDGIIFSVGARKISRFIQNQLAEGGCLVMPVGIDFSNQKLIAAVKQNGQLLTETIAAVGFHLLMSPAEAGWTDELMKFTVNAKVDYLRSLAREQGESLDQMLERISGEKRIAPEDIESIMNCFQYPEGIFHFSGID